MKHTLVYLSRVGYTEFIVKMWVLLDYLASRDIIPAIVFSLSTTLNPSIQ